MSPTPSRRSFLKHGAAAAAAASTALATGARARDAEERGPLKVGLVGCGGRGTGAASQALSAEDGTVVLWAMADVFSDHLDSSLRNLSHAMGEERADRIQVSEDRRFVGFDAYEKLLASGVDVVLLATPPHFRPAHLRAAIEAGKHVFTEKPIAVDFPGIRHVLDTVAMAERKQLSLVSGFCWRYNTRHRAFYKRLHNGHLGDLRAVYATYNASPLGTHERKPEWSETEFQLRNWQHFTWLSGDHLVEQAVHSVDKLGWAFGDEAPRRVVAVGGRAQHEGEARGNVFDHFSATFEYDEGIKGFLMCRQWAGASYENSDYYYGAKGHAIINGWAEQHEFFGDNPWRYDGEGNDMYQQEHDVLFASIRAGRPINDGRWMTNSTLMALMARAAAYTGQTISYEQAMESEERLGPDTYAWGDFAAHPVAIPGQRKFI